MKAESTVHFKEEIKAFLKGDVDDSTPTLKKYSIDASVLSVYPSLVVFPKDSEDIQGLVRFVTEKKKRGFDISLTARSAGTCMSGGSLNTSIIIDTQKYLSGIVRMNHESITVLPGTFYRDIEKATLAKKLIMPTYTASKSICAIGGMVMNNAGGEKTLAYGKIEDYIESLKIIFHDGKEYEIKALTKKELSNRKRKKNAEGRIYTAIDMLIKEHEEKIMNAKPHVSKNSAGYYIWNVWRDDGTFDLNRLIVGSQGTLGIVTEITLRLVRVKNHSKLLVVFLKDLSSIPEVVRSALVYKPESIESYDDHTFNMAIQFMPDLIKQMHVKNFLKFALSFLPEIKMALTGGIPKLVILVEFAGDSLVDIERRIQSLSNELHNKHITHRISQSEQESSKYWTMRRESFNLLRKHVKGKRTVPFIDDFIVRPEFLPEFLPKLNAILSQYTLTYTIAGHVGDGNFHIIPLMNMHEKRNKEIIIELSKKVYDLVLSYKGSITAEHNDGIIRTPFLEKMYGKDIIDIFWQIKDIFDPYHIFNPGKKVGGTMDYLEKHISED